MSAFIPVPNCAKVVLNYTKAGQILNNVFHVDVGATPLLSDLTAIGNQFETWWTGQISPYVSGDVTLQSISVTDISAVGGLGIEYTTGLPANGTVGAPPMPNNVTIASKMLTGRTGRSYRGRSYFVGMTVAYTTSDGQHANATFLSALASAWTNLLAGLVGLGYKLSVASLYSGVDADHKPIPRTTGILTEITNVFTNPTLDSQRRRLPERGS